MPLTHLARLTALATLTACLATLTAGPAPATLAWAVEATHASPQPCTATFTSGPVNRPIGHTVGHGMFSDTIVVPAMQAPISDLDVTMSIEHPRIVNLDISLGRNGVGSIDLARFRGTVEGQNYTGTILDDEADITLYEGQAPFTGRHRPDSGLSAVDQTDAEGHWSLRIQDTGASDEPYGTLVSWSMTMTFSWCDTDGDGLRDPVDRCPEIASAARSGCPAVSRVLSLRHDGKAFYGRLYADTDPACHARRPVNIWRVRAGTHRKVGSVITQSGGRYRMGKPRRTGRYYAVAPRVVLRDRADCTKTRVTLR